MNTTQRFDDAVTKLYTAYHNNTLDALDCKSCAVGNIVGHSDWKGYMINYNGVNDTLVIDYSFNAYPKNASYTPEELEQIEYTFLKAWEGTKSSGLDKTNQYKGLIAVVKLLAKFDNIPNPFNLENLFSDDKTIAKKELQLINK